MSPILRTLGPAVHFSGNSLHQGPDFGQCRYRVFISWQGSKFTSILRQPIGIKCIRLTRSCLMEIAFQLKRNKINTGNHFGN